MSRFKKYSTFALGALVGSLWMYAYDPVSGRRRRALGKDKLNRLYHQALKLGNKKSRHLIHKAEGYFAKTQHHLLH